MRRIRSTNVRRVVGHVARRAHDLGAVAEQPLAQVVLDRPGADARALGELAHPQQPRGSASAAAASLTRGTTPWRPTAGPPTAPDSFSAAISSSAVAGGGAAPRRCARRAPGRAGGSRRPACARASPAGRAGAPAAPRPAGRARRPSRARSTSSSSSASSSSSTGSRQQSCSAANASHSARVRAAKIASTSLVRVASRALELALDQVLAPDARAPVAPELRLQRAERHLAVGAGVGPVADDPARQQLRSALRHDAVAEVLAGDHRQPRQRAVGHRDVDELALARALALAQRGEDPERRHQRAAAEVGDLARGLDGRAVGLAGQAEQPDAAEVVHVVARSGRAAGRPGRSR